MRRQTVGQSRGVLGVVVTVRGPAYKRVLFNAKTTLISILCNRFTRQNKVQDMDLCIKGKRLPILYCGGYDYFIYDRILLFACI